MVPSLPLLSCESSVSVKKTLTEKKNKQKKPVDIKVGLSPSKKKFLFTSIKDVLKMI